MGLRALAGLWLSGLRQMVTLTADCTTCADGVGLKFAGHLADLNALLSDRRLAALAVNPAQSLPRHVPLIGPQAGPDAARRGLLGLGANASGTATNPLFRLQARSADSSPRMAFSPQIDAALCTGCDACVRLCPEDALSLIKDESGELLYRASSFSCSGCQVCVEVCSADAMRVEPLAPTAPDLDLQAFRCRGCGVDVHVPAAGPWAKGGLCPICSKTGHHTRLHQVLT